MKHSRTLLVPVALAALLVLAACSGTTASATRKDGLPSSYGTCLITGAKGAYKLKTLTPNTILVKADLPSPGWYNGDTIPKINSGFDFCLLANIAHRAGIDNVKLQNSSFDGLVAGNAGDMDMSLNQITITDARKQVMDFSTPYFQSTAGVLVKKGANVTAKNLKNLRIGVKQGTVGQTLVATVLKPTHAPSVFPGDDEMRAAVAAGTIDAGIQDLSIVLGGASQSKGTLAVVGQLQTDEAYGVMFPKGSPEVATVDKILADLTADGTLKKLSAKYLTHAYGVDPASVPTWNIK
jgi:polar amino acid transport system substrate-binding protein